MKPVLVDSNVILDIAWNDPHWADWSEEMVESLAGEARLLINPVIFAEISIGYDRIEHVNALVPIEYFGREGIPDEAAFLAGKAFQKYRRQGGTRTAPLPDFFIGAHAAVRGYRLLTRDRGRYRTYFPKLELIAPPQ
jgi:predicted nucleic acid-binding protein